MKIATYNVNGINGRLNNLLRWLKEDAPDIACLQELKTDDATFPRKEVERAGYGAVWHGQRSWNGVAILAKDKIPILTRRGLPGDPDDTHSRYIEAVIEGMLIGCLYLPNGNPFPSAKFEYKLRWFRRLHAYAAELLEIEVPSILAGDFNVMRRRSTYTSRSAGETMRFSGPKSAKPMPGSSLKAGRTPSGICIPTSASTPSGNIGGTVSSATPGFGSTTFSSARRWRRGFDRRPSGASRGAGSIRATTHPS
ncbi:exodeoxyribonuclease III [Rhizobium sp. NXC14]|uniref:exodeoxyribonuclease III n=1 Tax=Rhizobium sp. NXC14 TaxID=1981173 RepID=UPI0026913E60